VGSDERTITQERSSILVRTKSDLALAAGEGLPVSVVTGAGLGELRRAVAERVFADRISLADLEPALTRERHRIALSRARDALTDALACLGPVGEPVLAAHHLRQATSALEELLGVVDVEEVLDRVFGSFCVGK